MAEMDGTLVGTDGRRVLDAISAVHPWRSNVVNPSHAELDETFRFHELLGYKGITRIALKDLPR